MQQVRRMLKGVNTLSRQILLKLGYLPSCWPSTKAVLIGPIEGTFSGTTSIAPTSEGGSASTCARFVCAVSGWSALPRDWLALPLDRPPCLVQLCFVRPDVGLSGRGAAGWAGRAVLDDRGRRGLPRRAGGVETGGVFSSAGRSREGLLHGRLNLNGGGFTHDELCAVLRHDTCRRARL